MLRHPCEDSAALIGRRETIDAIQSFKAYANKNGGDNKRVSVNVGGDITALAQRTARKVYENAEQTLARTPMREESSTLPFRRLKA